MFKLSHKGITAPKHFNEKNDCAIRAVANASGKSYEDVHQIMKDLGRTNGLPMNVRMAAAGVMRAGGKLFICESLNDYRLKQGIYVVITQQHSFCLKDGEIIDTIKPDLSEKLLGIFKFI
jgi:hypothetical protein